MSTKKSKQPARSRYEFRVWGEQRDAHHRLRNLADSVREERLEDCYLLLTNPSCNLKIRRNRLKVKRLVDERFGFQRWTTDWHHAADQTVGPSGRSRSAITGQVDDVVGRAAGRLDAVVDGLHPVVNLRPVFVTKHRRRFRFGSMRAEVTDLEIGGQPGRMRTTAIDGRNLLDLIKLRSSLGFDLVPNVAVHLALDPRFQSS